MGRPRKHDPAYVALVVRANGGSRSRAAAELDVGRSTVVRALSRLPVDEVPPIAGSVEDAAAARAVVDAREREARRVPYVVAYVPEDDDGRVRVAPAALVSVVRELRTARAVLARGDLAAGAVLVESATRSVTLLASIPTVTRPA